MKIANAIRKLERAGFDVRPRANVHADATWFWDATSPTGRDIITFSRDGDTDTVATIKARGVNDHDDYATDYSAGVYVDTITRAIVICH